MVRPANAAKNKTASVACVDIVLSATIRSDTLGPAASRTKSRAAIANSAIATARQMSVIGLPPPVEHGQHVLHGSVDGFPRLFGPALGDLDGVILKLAAPAVEIDELVVHDQRGDEAHGGQAPG